MDKFENFVPYIWEKNKNTVLNNLNDIRILNILFDAKKRYDLIINNLGSSKIKIDDNDKLILFLRVILICQSKEKLNYYLVQKCSKNMLHHLKF